MITRRSGRGKSCVEATALSPFLSGCFTTHLSSSTPPSKLMVPHGSHIAILSSVFSPGSTSSLKVGQPAS
ncbi:hypothetical protein BDQ17DRAFT_1366709 [Cyathus striatus]|nr:hypothetical protein BDQ17DRAFT_1366709 [Cyathus striatus]